MAIAFNIHLLLVSLIVIHSDFSFTNTDDWIRMSGKHYHYDHDHDHPQIIIIIMIIIMMINHYCLLIIIMIRLLTVTASLSTV